jgi:hypothetical protein
LEAAYQNVEWAAVENAVFGWKRNCLQKIRGKEKYFRGGGCAASWRQNPAGWQPAKLILIPDSDGHEGGFHFYLHYASSGENYLQMGWR